MNLQSQFDLPLRPNSFPPLSLHQSVGHYRCSYDQIIVLPVLLFVLLFVLCLEHHLLFLDRTPLIPFWVVCTRRSGLVILTLQDICFLSTVRLKSCSILSDSSSSDFKP